MQSQMIGMQSSLDRILTAIQTQQGNGTLPAAQHAATSMYSQSIPSNSTPFVMVNRSLQTDGAYFEQLPVIEQSLSPLYQDLHLR